MLFKKNWIKRRLMYFFKLISTTIKKNSEFATTNGKSNFSFKIWKYRGNRELCSEKENQNGKLKFDKFCLSLVWILLRHDSTKLYM